MKAKVSDLEHVAPSTLVEWERNPRVNDHAVEAVARSIERFGFGAPIVARPSDRRVLAGHTRLKAALSLGIDEVPVRWLEVSDAEADAYSIADNRLGELATWDDEALAAILGDLREAEVDVEGMGWTEAELGDLLSEDTRPIVPLTDPDELPEPPEEPTTRLGDLWLLGRHRLLCGDATNAEDVARVMDGERPNLMVTDPPYGVNYDPTWRGRYDQFERHSTGKVTNDDQVDWSEVWRHFPGDVAYVWHAGVHVGEVAAGLARAGFVVRSQIVWVKQHFVFGRGHYHWKHEPCFYAVREGKTAGWVGDRKQITVWEVPNANPIGGRADDENTLHGTQKPVECMRRSIRNHEGDVYDPFLGSGTTLIAAEELGRTCYALEISPRYVDVAVRRWEAFTGETAERVKP